MRVQTERNETARLTFVAEWFHIVAGITHTYQLTFHLSDGGVEVVSGFQSFEIIIYRNHFLLQYDTKHKKTFLRRTKIPELTVRDFFVGSKVNIFGRQFDIVDYADESTRISLAKYRKR